jgi:hypothetical protein
MPNSLVEEVDTVTNRSAWQGVGDHAEVFGELQAECGKCGKVHEVIQLAVYSMLLGILDFVCSSCASKLLIPKSLMVMYGPSATV